MTTNHPDPSIGEAMFDWARDLYPICRSLTGDGVRATLSYLGELMPGLRTIEIPTGTKVLDWIVPDEWNVRDAWVADSDGNRLIDFTRSNLHLVGYSHPIDATMSRQELEPHLFSLPDQPTAIPYVTSYYEPTWGFCLSQNDRDQLGEGPFRVVIDSELKPGSMTYGELLIEGECTDEVLLSTYICHPSMANNELSGPVVTTALARWISQLPQRRYTYRLLFLPETIGAIVYMAEHLNHLRSHVIAGWVVTCVGDDRTFSYVPSRLGDTLADRATLQVLSEVRGEVSYYTYLDRGSDERQWCAPGADLPVCSLMRSKYGTYPEYHTSLDDLTLISPSGLQGSFEALQNCLTLVESNRRWTTTTVGEPQLGRRDLYPNTSFRGSSAAVRPLLDVLAYCDGSTDVIDLCRLTELRSTQVLGILRTLSGSGLIV